METEFSNILQRGVYVENNVYDNRGVVVFNDNYFDIKPKYIDYDKLLSHLVESITKALNISEKNNERGTFVIYVHLNPKRKHFINKKSMLNIITILNSLYKRNLYKCIFYNSNKYFRIIYGTIKPLLDNKLKKKLTFLKTTDDNTINVEEDVI